MALQPGTQLGSYEVVAALGAGGMGEVYRAHDPRLWRDVAIKVLPDDLRQDPKRRERFLREAEAVAGLSHPHICVLYDIGQHDGTDFLVMELLEGETLADRLKKGPLAPSREERRQVSLDGGLDPHWTGDGRELLYRTSGPSPHRWQVMAVDTSQLPHSGKPIRLFEAPIRLLTVEPLSAYALTRDGQPLLVIAAVTEDSDDPPPTKISFITNWFAELREKVPVRLPLADVAPGDARHDAEPEGRREGLLAIGKV